MEIKIANPRENTITIKSNPPEGLLPLYTDNLTRYPNWDEQPHLEQEQAPPTTKKKTIFLNEPERNIKFKPIGEQTINNAEHQACEMALLGEDIGTPIELVTDSPYQKHHR